MIRTCICCSLVLFQKFTHNVFQPATHSLFHSDLHSHSSLCNIVDKDKGFQHEKHSAVRHCRLLCTLTFLPRSVTHASCRIQQNQAWRRARHPGTLKDTDYTSCKLGVAGKFHMLDWQASLPQVARISYRQLSKTSYLQARPQS